jgi:hypothetical protein
VHERWGGPRNAIVDCATLCQEQADKLFAEKQKEIVELRALLGKVPKPHEYRDLTDAEICKFQGNSLSTIRLVRLCIDADRALQLKPKTQKVKARFCKDYAGRIYCSVDGQPHVNLSGKANWLGDAFEMEIPDA